MTTLVRWNPNRSIRRMHSDMDRLMEAFFESPRASVSNNFGLPLDVAETSDGYTISAAVPGLKSDDIDITVEEGILSISGEFSNSFTSSTDDTSDEVSGENKESDSNVKFHIRERRYGSFSRKLRLPKDVDADGIEAKQEDGILTITLAKSEAAQPKKITIG